MYSKRHRLKYLLKISLIIATALPLLSLNHVSADQNQNGYYIPTPLPTNDSSSNVIDQGADNQFNPNQSGLKSIIGKDPKNVGFDILYGDTKAPFKYLGEISPYQSKNDQGLRQMPTTKIGNYYRGWGYSGDSKKVPSYSDGSNEKDLHWTSMISGVGGQGDNIISVVSAGLYHLSNSIMSFMIELSGFDVQSIAQMFSDTGTPGKLAEIFLVSKNGISPLFMLAVSAFMLGLIGLGFRFMRGRASPKTILQEVGYMFLAMVFVALATNQNSLMNLSKIGQSLGNSFANTVVMSTSKNLNIFKTDNGSANRSNIITQKSILKSNYINAWIERETGYSVNALNTSSFASNKVLKDIQSKLAYNDSKHKESRFNDADAFQLKTGEDAKIDNLGYYLYASYSNVYISRWNYKMMPWISGNNPTIRTTSQDYTRGLTVVDFLNAIATDSRTTDAQKTKAKTILKNLDNPSRNDGSFIFQMLLLTALNVMLVIALTSIVIMMLVGKLILVIGVFVVIIFPILILIPQTRNFAKQLMNTYLIGFIKFAIGSTFFNVILALTVLLSSTGWTGTLVAMIVASFIGKFGPKLVQQIEAQLNSMGRAMGGQLPINNILNSRIEEAKNRMNRRQVVDPNTGMLVDRKDNSRFNNVLNGIKRGKSIKDLAKLSVTKKGPESSRFASDDDTMLFNGNNYDEEFMEQDRPENSENKQNYYKDVENHKEKQGNKQNYSKDIENQKENSENKANPIFVNKDDIKDTLSKDDATENQKYLREKARNNISNQALLQQNGKKIRTENLSDFGPLRSKQIARDLNSNNKVLDIAQSLKKTESDKNPIRAYKLRKLGSFATAQTLSTIGIVSPAVAKIADSYIDRENLNKSKRISTIDKMENLSKSMIKAGESITINDIANKNAENMIKSDNNKKLYDDNGDLNSKGQKKFNQYKKQSLIEFKTVPKSQLESLQKDLSKIKPTKTYVETDKKELDKIVDNDNKSRKIKETIPTRSSFNHSKSNNINLNKPSKLPDSDHKFKKPTSHISIDRDKDKKIDKSDNLSKSTSNISIDRDKDKKIDKSDNLSKSTTSINQKVSPVKLDTPEGNNLKLDKTLSVNENSKTSSNKSSKKLDLNNNKSKHDNKIIHSTNSDLNKNHSKNKLKDSNKL